MGNKYVLEEEIGRGGSGTVYKAYDLHLQCYRAVKRFEREDEVSLKELQILKALKHPALPAVTDYLEEEDGAFLIMEYVEGRNLEEYIGENEGVDEERAVRWAVQLAEVLIYLHERKNPLVYCDMKPANILIDPRGKLCLIDFGTACLRYRSEAGNRQVAGTYGYAAPEQMSGEGVHKPDEKWDVYGLGATLFHMLTGCNPSKPPYRMEAVRFYRGGISGKLEKIVKKATSQEPEKRYQTVRQLKEALQSCRKGEKIKSTVMKSARLLYRMFLLGIGLCFLAACMRMGVFRGGLVYVDMLKQKEILELLGSYVFLFVILFLGEKGIRMIKRRRKGTYRLIKNVVLTEKKGRGLFLLLLALAAGVCQAEEKPFRVYVRNNLGQKILIRYDAEYSPESDLRLEVPLSNFKAGERYELRLECTNRETKEKSSRTFYLKGLER